MDTGWRGSEFTSLTQCSEDDLPTPKSVSATNRGNRQLVLRVRWQVLEYDRLTLRCHSNDDPVTWMYTRLSWTYEMKAVNTHSHSNRTPSTHTLCIIYLFVYGHNEYGLTIRFTQPNYQSRSDSQSSVPIFQSRNRPGKCLWIVNQSVTPFIPIGFKELFQF